MRIIKEIPAFYRSAKYIEPDTKLGIFLSELMKRLNKESEFINFISLIQVWDFSKASLWAFEEILNYIDELLKKYSNSNSDEINKNILLPLLKFIYLLINNNYNKDIFASFDNLQIIYLTTFDIKIKTIIIEINLLFIDNKRSLMNIFKLFYRTFPMFINLKNILIDLINNNLKINNGIINYLEEILINIHKKWSNTLKQKKRKLPIEEQKNISEVLPFNLFKEIINNKRNYKKPEHFKDKIQKEYTYFTQGYINKHNILVKLRPKESVMKYIIKYEIEYIIIVNCFLGLVNEIIECSNDNKNNNNKIISIAKYILFALNLYIKDNQHSYDDEIVVSECYIENYYNDILKIITSPKITIDLKSVFLKCGITFMITFDGYDNILFQNGLFHSFLNDLTHQNGNDMEVLTLKDSNNQEFLNIILNFVFNFSIFKEIPLNFLSKILEIPKNNVYPYRIDNAIFSLKKKKIFDENILNQIIIPRIIYELENINIPSNELKYSFNDNNSHVITINERNNLIDRLFRILIRIIQSSTSLNSYGNFDQNLCNSFQKLLSNKDILTKKDYIPSIINSLYFYIKLCNSFPSKITTYINNNFFDLMIDYFKDYFPKYDGSMQLLFLLLYTICIHNDGKKYIKDNIIKIKSLFENIFSKLENDENFFYYNLFILKDLNKYELYSPFHALIHMEGVTELIQVIFENLRNFMNKTKNKLINIKINYNNNIKLNKELFLFESKRNFINEFFISFNSKDLDMFNNNLKVDIISLIKLYFDILLNTLTLYCLSSTYSISNAVIVLAKHEPVYVMEKIYDKFNELLNEKNKMELYEIQKDKIFSTLQKIFEFTFNKIYQKTKEKLNIHKYSMLFTKLIIDTIQNKTNISCYISPVNDRELVINSNYYCKFLSKKIIPEFRDLLIKLSYTIFTKDLPHTTNPNLLIIDEDNYKDLKYPINYNQNFRVEILHDSYFSSDILNAENKIQNYLLTSIDFFCSLGKMIKAKGLYDVKEEDVECIRNYMKLSYTLKQIIKYLGNKYNINEKQSEDEVINHILIFLSLFNMLNILLNGKNGKSISPIVIFYFIKYGGVREILKVAKNILYFCKKVFTKGELPLIELLIIKNFWNLLVSLLLSFIKYSFLSHNGYYTILIREGEFIKHFNINNELDVYARYLILNDFIEIFFDNNDINYNISVLKDIEMNSTEFTKGIYILFDTCCRLYQVYKDNNKENTININQIYNSGFKIYEIMQVIQEGKKTNEEIINYLNECKKNENLKKEENDKKKENENKMDIDKENNEMNQSKNNNNIISENEKDNNKKENNDEKNNSNNNINENNDNNTNINNNNNNNENNNNIEMRVIEVGFENENLDNNNNKDKEKKINKILQQIEEIPLYPDTNFINDIKILFNEKNDNNSMKIDNNINDNKDNNFSFNKHRNELYPYNNENYIKTINFICKILNKSEMSYRQVNDMRKMNLGYRIKEFEDKNDLLPYLNELLEQINNKKFLNSEIIKKLENELKYKKFMNYSILRYKTLNKNFYNNINISSYNEFINKNNIIVNALNSIKELINENKNINNNQLILKLIYENTITIYIIFCFLEHCKTNFEKEKKLFLETFLLLLKESNNEQNISFINEPILILNLQIIIQFFNETDKSQEFLNQFLNDNNLLKFILDLKFNPEDANMDFYDNKFKYFVSIDECFKQFIHKIFSEKTLYEHLLESVFKYALASIDCENYEVNFDDFIDLCSDYIKSGNNTMFENVIKKLFIIIEKEIQDNENENENDNNDKKENKKIYLLRLKEEYHKDIENIKNELNKYNKEKNNELKSKKSKLSVSLRKRESNYSNKSSKKLKGKIIIEEKIKKVQKLWSERNKSLFYTLLKHIWKTSTLIGEEVTKNQIYSTFSRNFIIDLDSSLAGLNCILHIFPSYLSLLIQFQNGKKHKISFIKYLIKYIFPLLNYYHYCISLPAHIKNIEDLENIILKEKKDVLRKYNNRANSFQSFFESFRYINIITSLMHSMTYKRRNMNENENLLINECRKKILNEINLILSDIAHQKINEFNFLNKDDDLFPKNVVLYKSCIIALFSMTEFNDNSNIYSHLNPFEISNLVISKEYEIVKNISNILKNMKIGERNEIFHEMGIKYLSQLFKYIKIHTKNISRNKNKYKIENKNSEIKKEDSKENNKNNAVKNNENENENKKKSISNEDERSIGYSENSQNSINYDEDLIIDNLNENDELYGNEEGEGEEEEEEGEEEEENEDGVEEDDDDDDEMLPEQILAQNNVEEDLFSLMRSDDEDSLENEDNEDINDIESFHINNLDLQIIRNDDINEENNEDNDNNFNAEALINRLELALGQNNNNQNQNEINNDLIINNNQNYNEENILFYNPFIDSASNINKTHIKSEVNIFYEEFIIFPFLVLRTKSKNNLIYFDRPHMSIDIFSNLDKSIVMKTSSLFLYYYLFPFDLNFERYFHFVLIGTKEKTVNAYFEELNKIMNEFFSMYSMYDIKQIEDSKNIIKNNLIENEKVIKTKEIIKKKSEKKDEKKNKESKKIDKDKDKKLNKNNSEDLKEENELLEQMPEELRDSIGNQLKSLKSIENDKNKDNDKKDIKDNMKEKQNSKESNNNNVNNDKIIENNNQMKIENDNKEKNNNENDKENDNKNNNNEIDIQFIMDLPSDLREDILLNLEPSMIENLSPELKNEYNRLISRNNEVILLNIPLDEGANSQINNFLNEENGDNDEIQLFPNVKNNELQLKLLKYKKEDILCSYNNINTDDNNLLIKIFDDEFIENLITFNIKTILTFKKKSDNSFNEYYELLNELIMNDNLRYKILDLLLDTWICDTSCLLNLLKSKKIPEKNNFLKTLYYLYVEKNLTEDYFFDDYEHFFINFATKHQKEMKIFFLKTMYNDNGSYILKEDENDNGNIKEYNITDNSRNIKEILNIKYKSGDNVLSNLISLTLLNSRSNLKTIFSIKIFTSVIKNCLKDINTDEVNNAQNNNNDNNTIKNELNISTETIEKIIDLFNNFETTLYLSKGQRSNNPTSLLIEMINDQNIYQILLDVLLKRIKSFKNTISKEMDDFFKNKKIDIVIFNKLLPEIILFKLVKLLSSINDNFNDKISEKEKANSKKKKEKLNNNNKGSIIKIEMLNKLKKFIRTINDILFSCWDQLNNLLLGINNILKDSQDILLPKLNRLIPYLETFITLSHLQFISTNSVSNNNIDNPFIFEQKFTSGKASPTHATFPIKSLNSKNEIDSFVEFFYQFCEKNKKIINFILRQYPKMFPNELIIKISSILDLENKQKYFRHSLKKLPSSHKFLQIQVRRNSAQLFSDSFAALSFRDAKELRGKLMVSFENEEAVDAGGVKREWLTLLSKEMFNPNYMLFTLAKNGTTYTINSDSGKYNPDHLRQFEFIGRIMAKAIFDGMMLDCYFTRIIYKLICGTPISYHDMEDYDPVYFNSLKWLLENDFTDQETYLTYSYNHENLGEIQTVDLIENGRNIEVTEFNKFDYIQKLCSSKLYDTIKTQIDALLKGFFEIIPQKLISIFNHRELELVISGLPTIDIKDWKNNTVYENYTEESNIIKYFWEIIESFDNDERAEFLQFVTGSSKVPLEGFSALQGIGGINKFKISKVFDKNYDRLPTAHTCTNQLELPNYPNKEILRERLTLAIREGKNSFGFV